MRKGFLWRNNQGCASNETGRKSLQPPNRRKKHFLRQLWPALAHFYGKVLSPAEVINDSHGDASVAFVDRAAKKLFLSVVELRESNRQMMRNVYV